MSSIIAVPRLVQSVNLILPTLVKKSLGSQFSPSLITRSIQTTPCLCKVQAGRPKRTKKKNNPVTYEEINPPHYIFVRKGYNSLNTSNLLGESRSGETAIEDMLIRKFVEGTWHKLLLSKLIIKRRANLIILSGIFHHNLTPHKFYFLQGYTEEILGYLLKCPVKMELQMTSDRKALVVDHV